MLLLHLVSLLIPSLIFHHLQRDTVTFFVPIMGRSGSEAKPDIIIGVFVTFGVIVLSAYHVSLFCLVVCALMCPVCLLVV